MGNMKDRNQFVDSMRGIAILLVVLGHTMTGCTVGAEESFLFNIVWSLQMPLFILISGYVTRYGKKISNGAGLWRYVKRRTLAYLLPWAVWSFLVRGIIFGQHDFLNVKWLLWHMDSGYWFLATIWTISLIFGLSAFFAGKIVKEPGAKQQAIVLAFYGTGMAALVAVGLIAGLSFFAIKLTLYYMPFYFAGYLYGQYREKILAKEAGRKAVDAAIAVCLAAWLFVILRYRMYALPDSGTAILFRAATSMAGCIAMCGLCKGVFTKMPGRLGTPPNRSSLPEGLPRSLSAAQPAQAAGFAGDRFYSRNSVNNGELCDHRGASPGRRQSDTGEPFYESAFVWKQKLKNGLLWAGKKSLEIYMIHGFVLNILKPEGTTAFSSIPGIALTFSNYVLTMLLCVVIISLIGKSGILKKILGMK